MPEYKIDVERKQCITPPVRGSYVSLLEARALPNSDQEAFGMQLRFDKKDPVTVEFLKAIRPIFVKVLIDKFGEEKAKKMAAGCKIPLRDGDDPKEVSGMSEPDQMAGCYFMNANNRFRQPYILSANGKPVPPEMLDADYVYSGAWYRCMLNFWWFDKAGNKGIGCTLIGVMKVKDDTRLDAAVTQDQAVNAFGDFASDDVDAFDMGGEEKTTADKKDAGGDFNFL